MKSYFYLASPYTALHDDGTYDDILMQERYTAVTECFQKLVAAGLSVYCPITMTHHIDCMHRNLHGNRIPNEFWNGFHKPFLQYTSQLYVLKLPGWEGSEGVTKEIKTAKGRNLPITYLEHIPTHATRLET